MAQGMLCRAAFVTVVGCDQHVYFVLISVLFRYGRMEIFLKTLVFSGATVLIFNIYH